MENELAKDIIDRLSKMESSRSQWDSHYNEVASYCLPSHAVFTEKQVKGTKKSNRLHDSTAPVALSRFASYMDAMLTPRSQQWHRISSTNEALNDAPAVKSYFDQVTETLFKFRYSARANFSSQMRESYKGLGAFGTSVMYIGEVEGQGHLIYRSLHLSTNFIGVNNTGIVDTVYRKFELTARQAVQEFGEDNLPDELLKDIKDKKNTEAMHTFIHAVYPSVEAKSFALDATTFPYASVTVSLTGKKVVKESGFRTFPYAIGRLETAPEEIYGRSPAMLVLPEIKMLNAIRKSNIRALHRQTEPPLLAFSDGIANRFSVKPNHINYGALNKDGRELIKPLITGDRPQNTLEEINTTREIVNDAFMITLFQILTDNGQMTATEVLQREQEKVELLSSQLDKVQSEQIASMIEREIDILNAMGVLPEMPPELVEAQGEYEIAYENPFAKLQRRQDIDGFRRSFGLSLEIAQVDPSVMDNWNFDAVQRDVNEAEGLKQEYLRTPEQVAEKRAAQQQQQEIEQLATAAPGAAQAVKNLAEAEAIRQ